MVTRMRRDVYMHTERCLRHILFWNPRRTGIVTEIYVRIRRNVWEGEGVTWMSSIIETASQKQMTLDGRGVVFQARVYCIS